MVRQIEPRAVADLLAGSGQVYLLDVRLPWEHDAVALPDSVLVPLHELAERFDEVDPPDGATVVVYCHHGVRSLGGASLLEQAGLRDVYSMAGGIDRWSREVDPKLPRY